MEIKVSKVVRYIITLIFSLLCCGCGGKKLIPAGRLHQSAGAFSFITPDGWLRTKLAGIDYIIVSAESDSGTSPNIFVDWVEPKADLARMSSQIQATNKDNYPDYEVIQQSDFKTNSGLKGIKIVATRKNRDGLPLAIFHYLIQDAERVIAITCSCSKSTDAKYEPIFDKTLKTLKTEKPNK